jgi:hypothetical protein
MLASRRFRTGFLVRNNTKGGLPTVPVDGPANDDFGRWVVALEPDTNLPAGRRLNTPQFALIGLPTVP